MCLVCKVCKVGESLPQNNKQQDVHRNRSFHRSDVTEPEIAPRGIGVKIHRESLREREKKRPEEETKPSTGPQRPPEVSGHRRDVPCAHRQEAAPASSQGPPG